MGTSSLEIFIICPKFSGQTLRRIKGVSQFCDVRIHVHSYAHEIPIPLPSHSLILTSEKILPEERQHWTCPVYEVSEQMSSHPQDSGSIWISSNPWLPQSWTRMIQFFVSTFKNPNQCPSHWHAQQLQINGNMKSITKDLSAWLKRNKLESVPTLNHLLQWCKTNISTNDSLLMNISHCGATCEIQIQFTRENSTILKNAEELIQNTHAALSASLFFKDQIHIHINTDLILKEDALIRIVGIDLFTVKKNRRERDAS